LFGKFTTYSHLKTVLNKLNLLNESTLAAPPAETPTRLFLSSAGVVCGWRRGSDRLRVHVSECEINLQAPAISVVFCYPTMQCR